MTDQELNNIWKSSENSTSIAVDHTKIIVEIASKLGSFHNSIKNRNRREIGVALFLLPVIIWLAYISPLLASKIITLLAIPWLFLVIFKLKKVKSQGPQNFNLPLLEFLTEQKSYLKKEKALLQNIAYWYILPPMLLETVRICISLSDIKAMTTHLLFTWAIGLVVYLLNKRAVRKDITPLIVETENTIENLKT